MMLNIDVMRIILYNVIRRREKVIITDEEISFEVVEEKEIGKDTIERKIKTSHGKYIYEYMKKHYTRVNCLISKEEEEVLRKLDIVPSKSQYIVELIKADIEREKREKGEK